MWLMGMRLVFPLYNALLYSRCVPDPFLAASLGAVRAPGGGENPIKYLSKQGPTPWVWFHPTTVCSRSTRLLPSGLSCRDEMRSLCCGKTVRSLIETKAVTVRGREDPRRVKSETAQSSSKAPLINSQPSLCVEYLERQVKLAVTISFEVTENISRSFEPMLEL